MKLALIAALIAAFPAIAAAAPTSYPLTIENCGAPLVIEKAPQRAVGLGQNSTEIWPLVGWEIIAAANPAVIVIGTMDRRTQGADDPQVKRRFLTSDPVVGKLDAVEKGRIVEMDAQAMNPTIRTIAGLEIVADALERFGLLK